MTHRLVVIVHGYRKSATEMQSVRDATKEQFPDAEILCPSLATHLLSFADPCELVVELARQIDAKWRAQAEASPDEGFDEIILVGHSMGAVLARKLWVVAAGELDSAPFEDRLRAALELPDGTLFPGFPWHTSIRRIVLLAAMNRGWRISHHLSLINAPIWAVGSATGTLLRLLIRRTPLIMTIRRGAEFITNLRVQWIRRANACRQAGTSPPLTIQLLGSRDDLVSPEDNIDLASGMQFVYLDVPHTVHRNVIDMDAGSPGQRTRRRIFQQALNESEASLRALAVIPSDDGLSAPDDTITDVIFVIHGIRDEGFWTHKIARHVRKLGQSVDRRWATETSSYGYFAMLPFIFPARRRSKVEWLMDQYAEAVARYPAASFHFVGHSNGTYLLAKAIRLYACCRFGQVVFAGSVVRRNYDWTGAIARGQAASVLNWVATRDWVVAFFPRFFEVIRIQDLGSAGHDGFRQHIHQLAYVRGGHAAAIQEDLWSDIARFIVHRQIDPRHVKPDLRRHRAWWVVVLGFFPPLLWVLIALGVYWLGVALNTWATGATGAWWSGVLCALYAWVVLLILRKV
jgi:hypothetical protein